MGNKKAAQIKVKVDLHKYNDQLHIYRLRSEGKRRTTRYVFHNVSSEDIILAMSGFITTIIVSTTEDSREHLYPHWAKAFKSKYMSADVETWTLSQALIQGALHHERAIVRHMYDPGFMRRDYEFVEMIEREDTTMNELVDTFTKQLYQMPPLLKGTIYKMDWDPKLTLFFINLPATMEFMLFFFNPTDTVANLHYIAPLELRPRHLHAAIWHAQHTFPLQDLHVDGKARKTKNFPQVTVLDTIEYTLPSAQRVLLMREAAIKVLRTCPTGEGSTKLMLTEAMLAFVTGQPLRSAQ